MSRPDLYNLSCLHGNTCTVDDDTSIGDDNNERAYNVDVQVLSDLPTTSSEH